MITTPGRMDMARGDRYDYNPWNDGHGEGW